MDVPKERGQLEARVYGIVQGVFFRHHTQEKALELKAVGTVENLPDGSVRVIAEGSRDNLQTLLLWLHEGPDLARVKRVDVRWTVDSGRYSDFRILR